MNITFHTKGIFKSDFKRSITDLVQEYIKSDFSRIGVPYERSFIAFLNSLKFEFDFIDEIQWVEIKNEIKRQL